MSISVSVAAVESRAIKHLDLEPTCTVVTLVLDGVDEVGEYHCPREARWQTITECCATSWLSCDRCRTGSLKRCPCGAIWCGTDTAEFDWVAL